MSLPEKQRTGDPESDKRRYREALDDHDEKTGAILLPAGLEWATRPAEEIPKVSEGERINLAEPEEIMSEVSRRVVPYNYSHLWGKSLRDVKDEIERLGRPLAPQSIEAIDNLISSGIIVNNQTVLLKGVNDNSKTIAKLLNKLVSIGVNPYYIFQCRPVKRVKHHFQVPIVKGIEIIEKAKEQCNGHSKRFRYILSHRTGKIEILGIFENQIYFKYHQAKNRNNLGKIFKIPIDQNLGWLDNFKPTQIQLLNPPNYIQQ